MTQVEFGIVKNMAALRMVSSFIELVGAIYMLRSGTIQSSLRVNALLGLAGPVVLIGVTLLGVAGIAGEVDRAKLLMIAAGVALVFLGTK